MMMCFDSPASRGSSPAMTELGDVPLQSHAERPRGGISSRTRKLPELLHDALIDLALERHDQFGKILHRLPAPAHEFGLVAAGGARDVDLVIPAGEAHRIPFLLLAAITALPGATGDGAGDVVGQPFRDFGE